MSTTKRAMPKRRTERQRSVPDPSTPAPAPKGKRGQAATNHIKRSKEPLKAGVKVK